MLEVRMLKCNARSDGAEPGDYQDPQELEALKRVRPRLEPSHGVWNIEPYIHVPSESGSF